MVTINLATKEISCKIVYYGPGLGGKTSNVEHIYKQSDPSAKGKLVKLDTETERTLFFDFMPLQLGEIRGFKTRFHLYTVPGQIFYKASRKLIVRGLDGIIFVADSHFERMDANILMVNDMLEHLAEYNLNFRTLPYVLQLNKRDGRNILSVDEMKRELVLKNEPVIEAVANQGIGVFDTLKAAARLVLTDLKNRKHY
ncbi:MAG: gliding-motility protein MglA [Blastocatellia bacterium]|nr:gliding-motility protein MglA [Blastocatellia bacterium]